MTGTTITKPAEKVIEKTSPLRIWERGLACSYEISSDDRAVLRMLDRQTGQIELSSIGEDPSRSFRRDLLYSKTWQGGHVVTARGYVYDGEVNVSAWVGKDVSRGLTEEERKIVYELARVNMYHVGLGRGLCEPEPKKEPATLDQALIRHRERTRILDLKKMTLEELEEFYNLLKNNVPRY